MDVICVFFYAVLMDNTLSLQPFHGYQIKQHFYLGEITVVKTTRHDVLS